MNVFNNGGQIPDRFIELLIASHSRIGMCEDGKNWQWPPVAHFGSMAMLMNGWSGSGGDAFPGFLPQGWLWSIDWDAYMGWVDRNFRKSCFVDGVV
jgi:tricorn protease